MRENAAAALKSFSQEMRGTVALAASTVPSQYYLPRLLRDFHEKYPDISFSIQMEDSPRVVELVASRTAEIGFCGTKVALRAIDTCPHPRRGRREARYRGAERSRRPWRQIPLW